MASSSDFVNGVLQWNEETKEAMVEEMRALVRVMYNTLVRATPVYTGRMRASWIVSVNGNAGATRTPNPVARGTATTGAERSYLYRRTRLIQKNRDNRIEIWNSAPYSTYIINGSARRPPDLFLQSSIQSLEHLKSTSGLYTVSLLY